MHLSPAVKDAAVRLLDRRPTGELPEAVGGERGETRNEGGAELLGQYQEVDGAPGTRTRSQRLKRPLLYH